MPNLDHCSTLVMDFDSTIICEESLELLADIALADAPDRAERRQTICTLTNQAMSGELPFDRALQERIALLKAHRDHLTPLIEQLHTLITPSFLAVEQQIRTLSSRIYVMSGGFTEFIAPVMHRFGIEESHIIANRFVYDAEGWIVGVDTSLPLSQDDGKTLALQEMHLPRPLWMIGDGFSDYQVKRSNCADVFFAFTENIAREKVLAQVDGKHCFELQSFEQLFG